MENNKCQNTNKYTPFGYETWGDTGKKVLRDMQGKLSQTQTGGGDNDNNKKEELARFNKLFGVILKEGGKRNKNKL